MLNQMLSQFTGAVMSEDRTHRFLLYRLWDDRPRMLFIGLNPSTASEMEDDPTIRRLIGFARDWGYGGLFCCNVFSQVTPYPAELDADKSTHPADIPAIQMAVELTKLTVCGWGDGVNRAAHGLSRVNVIGNLLKQPKCFGLTASGNPRHPLYLPKTSELEDY